MNIRLLMALLVISLLLGFTRRWRKVGLVLSAVFAALLIWFTANQSVTQQDPSALTTASSSSAAADVKPATPAITLLLDGNGAPWRLSGTVANLGNVSIRSITLNVERLDCPLTTSPEADCYLVWRGEHTLRMNIAAAKSARIDDSFYSHETVPRLKGVARDHIMVVGLQ